MNDLNTVFQLIQTFGVSAIFVWLYMQERQAHNDTRKAYLDDLRALSGLGIQLRQNRQIEANLPESE